MGPLLLTQPPVTGEWARGPPCGHGGWKAPDSIQLFFYSINRYLSDVSCGPVTVLCNSETKRRDRGLSSKRSNPNHKQTTASHCDWYRRGAPSTTSGGGMKEGVTGPLPASVFAALWPWECLGPVHSSVGCVDAPSSRPPGSPPTAEGCISLVQAAQITGLEGRGTFTPNFAFSKDCFHAENPIKSNSAVRG